MHASQSCVLICLKDQPLNVTEARPLPIQFNGIHVQPPPRGGHASAALGNKLICFGGADRVPTSSSEIWTFQHGDPNDLSSSSSLSVHETAKSPSTLSRLSYAATHVFTSVASQHPIVTRCT